MGTRSYKNLVQPQRNVPLYSISKGLAIIVVVGGEVVECLVHAVNPWTELTGYDRLFSVKRDDFPVPL